TDLRDLQHPRDVRAEFAYGVERLRGALARDEELGLQLLAAARRELGTEVRQTLVPGARHGQLRRAVLRRHARHRVRGLGGERAAEPLRPRLLETAGRVGAQLAPYRDRAAAPIREAADAVSGGEDLRLVRRQLRERDAVVDVLGDLERRLHVDGQV